MDDLIPSSPAKHHDPKHHVKEVSPKDSTFLGFEFAMDLGFTIAIPAVIFGLLGRWADLKWGIGPWGFLGGLSFAFITSFISIYKKVRIILARMPKDLPRKKKVTVDPELAKEQEAIHELFRPPNS